MTDVTFSVPPTYQNDNGTHFQSCILIGTPKIPSEYTLTICYIQGIFLSWDCLPQRTQHQCCI